jgi:hypothetical protein
MEELLARLVKPWEGRGAPLSALEFLLLLALSGAAALVIGELYLRFYGRRATGSEIHRAFPLLAVSITAIFVCIQFSLPLSLGLLGALSIVRFRTPIKEPEEIGFLMVVIATSLAAATGLLAFLGVLLAVAVAILLLQELARRRGRAGRESGLVIATFDRAAYDERGAALLETLARSGRRGALESLSAQDGRVTVVWRFAGLAAAEIPALERSLAERVRPEALSIVSGPGGASGA